MNTKVWWEAYTAISRHVLKAQFLIYLTYDYEHTSAAYLQAQTN